MQRVRADAGDEEAQVTHTCHWPECPVEVPPKLWGCRAHWYRLPKELRDRIWVHYRPGQEIDKEPSDEYLRAADLVQEWIQKWLLEHVGKCPIVKVQVTCDHNIAGSGPRQLIYSEDRKTIMQEGPADHGVIAILNGRPKAFFYTARRVPPRDIEDTFVLTAREAPAQDW